jgi:hypothetical protein
MKLTKLVSLPSKKRKSMIITPSQMKRLADSYIKLMEECRYTKVYSINHLKNNQ